MHVIMANIKKIITLHTEITEALKSSLEKAILIGQLLIEQKEKLKHGEFTSWIKKNLPFTDRTARNYIKLFNNKDMLKTESVSDLNSAYKLLEAPKGNRAILEKIELLLGQFSICYPPETVDNEEIQRLMKSLKKPNEYPDLEIKELVRDKEMLLKIQDLSAIRGIELSVAISKGLKYIRGCMSGLINKAPTSQIELMLKQIKKLVSNGCMSEAALEQVALLLETAYQDWYTWHIKTASVMSKEILEENNSADDVAQVVKCLKIMAQDSASLLLDAETQAGELLKVT